MRSAALAVLMLILAAAGSAAPSHRPITRLLTRPAGLTTAAPWTAEVAVAQAGRPLVLPDLRLWIRRPGVSRNFRAVTTARAGTYRAQIVFPAAGSWRLGVSFRGFSTAFARIAVRLGVTEPFGTAVEPTGSLLIADRAGNRVVRRDRAGRLAVVAGSGARGLGRDGIAIEVAVQEPLDVALDGTGNVYVASENRVLKIDRSGILTRIAGTGARGTTGDGGLARNATIDGLGAVALDAAGNLFVTEYENRIRRVDAAAGTINTYAGTGAEGYSGDGGPARTARIFHPHGLDVAPDGSVYIADSANHRIRRVDGVTGVITTVAGTGEQGYSGDGGLAKRARLSSPVYVAADRDGTLYVADLGNRRIRKVDAAGTITSVSTAFEQPIYVALDGGGGLWVSELESKRLRRLDLATRKVSPPVR